MAELQEKLRKLKAKLAREEVQSVLNIAEYGRISPQIPKHVFSTTKCVFIN